MLFETISIVSGILILLLTGLFLHEKKKVKQNFLESKNHLDQEVTHLQSAIKTNHKTINDIIERHASENELKFNEIIIEALKANQVHDNLISENGRQIHELSFTTKIDRAQFEKYMSENDQSIREYKISMGHKHNEILGRIEQNSDKIQKYVSDAEVMSKRLKNDIDEHIMRLTDRINSQDSLIRKLREDNEILRKKLAIFTEIGADSTQLNEEVDFEDEEQNIKEAVKELREKFNELDDLDQTYLSEGQAITDLDVASILDSIVGTIPDNIKLDSEQLNGCLLMERTNENLFITGKAGTGKSFLLKVFVNLTKKKTLKLAPTGIAALNIGGTTIHSAFGFNNLVLINVDNINRNTLDLAAGRVNLLREVETLIIDEISMVRADIFHKMDRILRVVNNNDTPFGGKQIIAFGDLFQLPPIADEKEEIYLKKKYGGIFFFNSDAYKEGNFQIIELDSNHRQKQDSEFFEILNRMRIGNVSDADIAVINKHKDDSEELRRIVRLFPKKAEAERVNQSELDKIPAKEYTYQAKVLYQKYNNQNKIKSSDFPIEPNLKLKLGALVMMVKNDSGKHWVNGTLGIISSLSDDSIKVMINEIEYEVQKQVFESREANLVGGHIEYDVILKVEQYPVVLGYALTIHKSQGQTYKKVACDITDCFAPGQAYVALSRCSTLDGLHLIKEIDRRHIEVNSEVKQFYLSSR